MGQVDDRHAGRATATHPRREEHILGQEDGKKRWVQVVSNLQEEAVKTVLAQAELFCAEWV